ncbi:porin [Ralstonia sp. SET104]|jgi:predicted porin|uniref:porin n=1 Tax=Ralstonia sp. SET104 TaxID=2448774 RepID=UPI000F56AF61|nr:porin [Ralstonia sp. SET104]GCB03553.1 porin [Ralstonia sp. SET104]
MRSFPAKFSGIALLALTTMPSMAQTSVTLYGVADDALAISSNQGGHANYYTRSGNLAASRFGLRGAETLGAHTKAIFDLQEGFDINSGKQSNAGVMFNRQAFVGLQDQRYGTLTMGRQYTAYYQMLGAYGPVSMLTGATGAHPGDLDGLDTTIRFSNSVMYTTPDFGGFTAAAQYGFGEIAGKTQAGSSISAAARYIRGPLALGVGYLRMYNTGKTTNQDPTASGSYGASSVTNGFLSASAVQHIAAIGTYQIGKATVGLNYSNVQFKAGGNALFTNTAVFNTYGIIGKYELTPQFDVAGGYSYTRASSSNGISDSARYHQVSLKQAYHFSKRTTLYVLEAYQHASGKTLGVRGAGDVVNATATVGDSQNANPSSGATQFVGMVGISHNF